ncbi:MAG TPA: hypothetical protein VJV23_02445 [Candidatus Polarisedimenticolia bacterium]|nr:hypothetical protein [Candidatus Polarisedimenticolia bacterium]
MPTEPSSPQALIRRTHRLAGLLFLVLAGVFVFKYRSEGAALGPYSTRYWLGVIAPYAALAVALVAAGRGVPRGRRRSSGPIPAPALWTTAAATLAAGWFWAFRIADELVSVGMMVLVPLVLLALLGRLTGAVEPLLAGGVAAAAGIALFAVELPGALSRPALVVWGDDATFATLFPKEPPFLGEGGRLRPRLDVLMRAPEYRTGARLATDRHGFRNVQDVPAEPSAGEHRILSLGDSFSTGYCADQEEFFGSLLEKEISSLLPPGRSVRVLNAEVSDPAYGLLYLQEHGLSFRPHLIVYGLSGNDAMQAEQFLGPDRLFHLREGRLEPNPGFDPSVPSAWDRFSWFAYPRAGSPSSSLVEPAAVLARKLLRFRLLHGLLAPALDGRHRPADMPGYASAYEQADGRKRLIDGASNLGLFYRPGGGPVEAMHAALLDLLDAMEEAARRGGARFLVVVHPQRYQVQTPDWEFLVRRWGLDPAEFDLRLYNRRLAEGCTQRGLDCCDLVEGFATAWRRDPASLYLPGGDTHFSRLGHRTAAALAAECVGARSGAR